MVFEAENYAALFGPGQAFFDTIYDPLEAIVFGVAGKDRLNASIGHQIVEAPCRAPSTRVNADNRDAKPVSDFNLFEC